MKVLRKMLSVFSPGNFEIYCMKNVLLRQILMANIGVPLMLMTLWNMWVAKDFGDFVPQNVPR